jgi:hypothetical protein
MIKLINILTEIKVVLPIPNNLRQLEQIKVKLEQTKDRATEIALAIKAAEMVLPIFEYYYPKDKRVLQTIEATKRNEYDNNAFEAYNDTEYAASDAAYTANAAAMAASNVYLTAIYSTKAVEYAIKATKEHFKLK